MSNLIAFAPTFLFLTSGIAAGGVTALVLSIRDRKAVR